jgi:hypothetical protein
MRVCRPKSLITVAVLLISTHAIAAQPPDAAALLKKLPAGENILWQDPGNVEALDFIDGVGGPANRPQAPFQFIEEDMSGTNPKVKVKDARGTLWSVKWGKEAKPSVFATRLVWACGYTVETEYLLTRGQILGAHGLKRAAGSIQGDGYFSDARFQLRSDHPKFLKDHNWAWTSNPSLGTPQLNGLKILVMLLSNWDTKDARDFAGSGPKGTADSNLAIFQDSDQSPPLYLFFISDWGASLGKWGSAPGPRSKWDCKGYTAQTPDFVQGVDKGIVRWGYSGKHNDDIVKGIRVTDVQWLMQYLGRVTDDQLRRGLAASGAAPEQMDLYLRSIRQRINQLQAQLQAVTK